MRADGNRKKRGADVFSITEKQCIWMKAGVINFKLCENAYDCLSCPFDKAMSRAAEQSRQDVVGWRETMRGKAVSEKECRHMLTGRVSYHFCSNNYRCNSCEFDQYLDEADLMMAGGAVHAQKLSGFEVADSYYYHRGHSWARVEHGGFVRVGLDDFALRLLGCPTAIRLPKLGTALEQTEAGWSIARSDHTATVLAPMQGVVVAVNQKAAEEPAVAKRDPFGAGWLLVLEPKGLRENLKNLLFDREVPAWMKAEAQKLDGLCQKACGVELAATGGEIVEDIYGALPQLGWEEIVREFLLT